jgi:hypothetical protein
MLGRMGMHHRHQIPFSQDVMDFDPMAGESRIEQAQELPEGINAGSCAHKWVVDNDILGKNLVNYTFLFLVDKLLIDTVDNGFVLFC